METEPTRRVFTALVLAGLIAGGGSAAVAKAPEPQVLVDASTRTFNTMMADKDMGWLRANIHRAKAVIIAPSVAKAGFVFGGSGGRAVLIVHNKAGVSSPIFYSLGTASIGFQAGVSESQILTLVMTDTALASVLKGNFKVGGDASAAIGPVGGGAKADVDAAFITYSRAKGLYGGVNFDGTKINIEEDWNAAYYGGKPVTPTDILAKGKVKPNPGADALRAAVRKYAG